MPAPRALGPPKPWRDLGLRGARVRPGEDDEHAEALVADEAMLGTGGDEHRLAFPERDLLALDLERRGRPSYYRRETARVGGKPKVGRTTYLGRAEDILARLGQGPEPLRVESRSFGAVAAALKVVRQLGVVEAIDRACGSRGRPSVGT